MLMLCEVAEHCRNNVMHAVTPVGLYVCGCRAFFCVGTRGYGVPGNENYESI